VNYAFTIDPVDNHKFEIVEFGAQVKEVEFIEDVGWGGGRVSSDKVNLTGQEHLLGMQKEKVKKQIVELIQLDAVVKEDILLLKIDTEGYEEFVIQGSKSVFKDHNVHNVLIEVKTQNDPTKRDFMYHLMKEVGHFTHVYMFHDVYNHNSAYMQEVTDIIAKKKYNEKLTSQDYWFRKEALPLV
jgi:FkbM family methyltransferase